MHTFQRDGRTYLQFDSLRGVSGLTHAFSTRPEDVSARVDERMRARAERRRRMAGDLGLDGRQLAYCVQVHRDQVAVIGPGVRGAIEGYDAIISNLPDAPLMTFSADCPLILLYSAKPQALGLVHASWRCTAARLVQRALSKMTDFYGVQPGSVQVGIGPGAGACCYEVKNDVVDAFAGLPAADECLVQRDGRIFLDLWRANVAQLVASSVSQSQIELSGICTMCRTDLLFSFRREMAGCGHFGLMAALTAG